MMSSKYAQFGPWFLTPCPSQPLYRILHGKLVVLNSPATPITVSVQEKTTSLSYEPINPSKVVWF